MAGTVPCRHRPQLLCVQDVEREVRFGAGILVEYNRWPLGLRSCAELDPAFYPCGSCLHDTCACPCGFCLRIRAVVKATCRREVSVVSNAVCRRSRIALCLLGFSLVLTHPAFAANGKISGSVVDVESGDPLADASVGGLDARLGAASKMDGTFLILGVPGGTYTLKVMMMGYQDGVLENVRVDANRTT